METLLLNAEKYVFSLLTKELSGDFFYHNLSHTQRVVNATKELIVGENISEIDANILLLAAWFHDVGYTKGVDNHEEASVRIVTNFLQEYNIDDSIINNVNNKLEMQNAFVSSLVILSAFCFSFLIVIQYFFSLNLSHNIYLIALIGSATLISKCFIGVFLVDGDLYIYNIALFFTRFLYLILSAILIYLGFEVEGVLYSFLLVQVLLIIIVIKQKKLTFNLNNCKQSVSQLFIHSLKVHTSTLGTRLIRQVPLILVGLISTKSNVALFDSALQVISVLVLVVSSLTPVVYSYTANMSFDGSYKRTINLIKWSYCISSGFVLLFFIYSEELIGFLFGASFMGASPILKVLLIMFWFNVINYFVTPVWVMNNHALRLSVVNIFFGIVNTVGAYFFLRYSDIIKISWLMAFSSLL